MKIKKVESIIMEILTKRYVGICEENNMRFPNYEDSCQEESINQVVEDKKRQIKILDKQYLNSFVEEFLELINNK